MYILFDIGGTKSRFAISHTGESFDDPVMIDTPTSYPEAIVVFNEIVIKLVQGQKITHAVGGFAGVVHEGKVLRAPNLPDFEGKLLAYELERIFTVKPVIENDADMAALGEAMYGSAQGASIVAYITVSTGIGGGLVIDGQIQKKKYGFEPGHQIINYHPREVLHDLISGHALEKKYGKPAKEIKEPEIYEWIAQILGVALTNTILHWSPDVLVLGGSITKDIDLGDVEMEIQKNMTIFPDLPVIKRAELGSFNGLWGALVLLKSLRNN